MLEASNTRNEFKHLGIRANFRFILLVHFFIRVPPFLAPGAPFWTG
ncbi:hypothetical protein NC651_021004 [Populus alba x Populus x berolinensis]|nr:hypothetical protein NC651_021004 [Populus alba x Populus x berolinensis]